MNDDHILELVYDDEAWPFILQTWPQATYTDASDFIHEHRIEVMIPNCTKDEFYPHMLLEGWATVCLGFELSRMMPEHQEDVKRWVDKALAMKAERDAEIRQ